MADSGRSNLAVGQKRFLLISRIGARSLHRHWLSTDERSYDVLLSRYDDRAEEPQGSGLTCEFRPGTKISGYSKLFREHSSLWKRYEFVGLFDEDIETDPATIDRMFAIGAEENLKIFQPALTQDSYFSYAALLQNSFLKLRYVNYVEMMCPVFRSDVLDRVQPLFSLNFESGIDLIWCNAVSEGPHDFAVIDAAPVRHTEPVGGRKQDNGFSGARRYEDDIAGVLNRFGVPWLSCVPYAAVTRGGQQLNNRVLLALIALAILPAAFRRRPWLQRLRLLLIHFRHMIFRRPRNVIVLLPKRVDGLAEPG